MSINQVVHSSASIFLNGGYPAEHEAFYRTAIIEARDQRYLIAVDGGLLLFYRFGLKPDLILGDFDSIDRDLLDKFRATPSISYPKEKDESDGEIALRKAIDFGHTDIEIYGAIDTNFETDHLFASLLLLKLARTLATERGIQLSIRAVDHRQFINHVENESIEIRGKVGDFVSVIALSERITLSLKGMQWDLDSAEIQLGSSRTLHNRMETSVAQLTINGNALLIHRHS